MAWSASGVFAATMRDAMNNVTALTLSTDTTKVALFDNTITPDKTVASASTAYGAGVWASGGQSSSTSWPAAGRPVGAPTASTTLNVTSTFSSNVYTFSGNTTVSNDASCTLSGTYGCLIADTTLATPVANQGVCFNYFGGAASVTSGTFSVVWSGSGIFTITT